MLVFSIAVSAAVAHFCVVPTESVMPLLAEIADKMPPIERVWGVWIFLGIFAAGFTLALSMGRLRFGAVVVFLSGCLGILAASPDSIMDPAILTELGKGYLFQQRASAFLPFSFALIVWIAVAIIRRHNQTRDRTGFPQ